MAYQIEYDGGRTRYPQKKRRKFPWKWLALAVVAAVMAIPGLRTGLWHWILPGDGAVTAQALGELVSGLRSGEPVGEAVGVFCREIMANGG